MSFMLMQIVGSLAIGIACIALIAVAFKLILEAISFLLRKLQDFYFRLFQDYRIWWNFYLKTPKL
jgi:hypothetical protein